MTLVASWVAMDDNKKGKLPASLYLASDSRITYLNVHGTPVEHRDDMQKIFISKMHPEMFAICGDYFSCRKIVKNLVGKIDSDIEAIGNNSSIDEKVLFLKAYFYKHINIIKYRSVILYATKVKTELYLYRFFLGNNEVDVIPVSLGKLSQVVARDGSGEDDFYDEWIKFNKNTQAFNEADTSRGAFRCIFEAINNIEDQFVGGRMQAAVLYRGHKAPHPIGIYYGNDCYLFGKVHVAETDNGIEYRNSEFEIVDPKTGKIANGAQRQPFAKR